MKPGEQITIVLQGREDGGLRVWSDDLPGLILSGEDSALVAGDIWPVVETMLRYKERSDAEG